MEVAAACEVRPPSPATGAVCCSERERDKGARVLGEHARLRLVDFRLPPNSETSVTHAFPTLRWRVLSDDAAQWPVPRFFEKGSICELRSGEEELRELVYEFLDAKPKFDDAAIKELTAEAKYDTNIGTKLSFENEWLRAVELAIPPSSGDGDDIHQHILDYALTFIGPTTIKMYKPGLGGRAEEVTHVDIEDGATRIKDIPNGGFNEDGTPNVPDAVHQVTNGRSDAWLRCYQVELK